MSLPAPATPWAHRRGRVVAFDEDRGLGEVEADDGARYGFHCTALADGSRRVAGGSRVAFTVVAGGRGRWEAAAILKLDD